MSSDLLRTELARVALRLGVDEQRADAILTGLVVLPVTTMTFRAAGALVPENMGTLEALHLAAALDLADELEAILTYDDRLAGAAFAHGIDVVAPS